ncbi:hypothetical protein BS50DRAFT_285318 [Corynespora cassiicola Philippines]|uniref:Uncharacterized protein n=1 Tax=Corynespora cassiicola Philippines TaxID=1448308 RepID=A0A2T2P1N0_CORCC|nr:hypothetical protein BS50DRAFT_285318 [Corynespora cassiicola Philippines]
MEEPIRKPQDILDRASRPQIQSRFIPKKRDWRYATGVFQHDDHEQGSWKVCTTWDYMDLDASLGKKEGRFKATRKKKSPESSRKTAHSRNKETSKPMSTTFFKSVTQLPAATSKNAPSDNEPIQKFDLRHKSNVASDKGNGTFKWAPVGLIAVLKFTDLDIACVDQIPVNFKGNSGKKTGPLAKPTTVKLGLTPKAVAPRGGHKPAHSSPQQSPSLGLIPFQREFVDNTQEFNMCKVLSRIRTSNRASTLDTRYNFIPSAVPCDSIFPPGIPLSSKEILAYFPHSIRHTDVLRRLMNNNYRGRDIQEMIAWFRGVPPSRIRISAADIHKTARHLLTPSIPDFRPTKQWKGTPDRTLHTARLSAGPFLEQRAEGFAAPTFTELVAGLATLPTGLHARELTAALEWWLQHRGCFTPPLDFSVLHVRALVLALRIPIRGYGRRNLDRVALREWADNGAFTRRGLEEVVGSAAPGESWGRVWAEGRRRKARRTEVGPGTEAEREADAPRLPSSVAFNLRDVFTFPFFAMHSLCCEALRLGIGKAERAREVRIRGEECMRLEVAVPSESPTPAPPFPALVGDSGRFTARMNEFPGIFYVDDGRG